MKVVDSASSATAAVDEFGGDIFSTVPEAGLKVPIKNMTQFSSDGREASEEAVQEETKVEKAVAEKKASETRLSTHRMGLATQLVSRFDSRSHGSRNGEWASRVAFTSERRPSGSPISRGVARDGMGRWPGQSRGARNGSSGRPHARNVSVLVVVTYLCRVCRDVNCFMFATTGALGLMFGW